MHLLILFYFIVFLFKKVSFAISGSSYDTQDIRDLELIFTYVYPSGLKRAVEHKDTYPLNMVLFTAPFVLLSGTTCAVQHAVLPVLSY